MFFRLLAISDRHSLDESLESWLRRLADAGVGAVQLREKDLDDRELYDLACRARRALPATVTLLLNGRPDVALASGADGVHLPSAGLPLAPLRRHFGRRLILGRSTHHPDEVAEAQRQGADYVTFGPVYPTPSKAAYGPPPGLAGLRRAIAGAPPVYALGGITPERLAEVAAAGAAGAAGIRIFQQPETLIAAARQAAACWPPAALHQTPSTGSTDAGSSPASSPQPEVDR
jgi:thiamine-phosphate pyrophosphorylase